MASRYTFAEYSPEWPAEFEREAARWRTLLGGELLEIHHVGSTSVPGLAAKPVIDVLPLVREIGRIDEMGRAFAEAGYKAWGEYGISGRRFFTKDRDGLRTHNVHVFERGNHEVERHLAFCAYLRAHGEVSQRSEELKRAVYAEHPDDIEAYNDGKDAWIKRVEKLAVAWWREEGFRAEGE